MHSPRTWQLFTQVVFFVELATSIALCPTTTTANPTCSLAVRKSRMDSSLSAAYFPCTSSSCHGQTLWPLARPIRPYAPTGEQKSRQPSFHATRVKGLAPHAKEREEETIKGRFKSLFKEVGNFSRKKSWLLLGEKRKGREDVFF